MAHGGGSTKGAGSTNAATDTTQAPPAPVDPQNFPGFSYFLGVPTAAQRTTLGQNPSQAREVLQALHALLPVAVPQDNSRIPSGYTYLLQLIAHDLVESTVPFWVAADAGLGSSNQRGPSFQLDTLYGGGPTACPMAFKPAGATPDFRTDLRLGRIEDATSLGLQAGACPFRDLARMQVGAASASGIYNDGALVYVADQRSDENVIIAQLVVLFSILHNAIVARLPALSPQARFGYARVAMLQMYYAVIRHDVLRRLLHDQVYQTLQNRPSSGPWLWQGNDIPLEFSHGAFRVGHAMVRPFYIFNDSNTFSIEFVLRGPQVGNADRDPLPSNWILAWSKFFELAGTPNYSLKLSIRQQLSVDFSGILPPIGSDTPDSLTLRDWLSAAMSRSWRLDALLKGVAKAYPGFAFAGAKEIRQWLQEIMGSATGKTQEKAIVSQNAALLETDLPLPLYVLLEAQRDPANGGQSMGPLGSIIVGEVIFKHLVEEEARLSALIPAAQRAMGDDWSRIASINGMPDLVKLAADWGGLADCRQVPFIAG